MQKAVDWGWRVVPLANDNKVPHIKWKPYQDRAPTSEELANWARAFPDCCWAFMTGQRSGVLVLDFDVSDGGMETLAALGLKPLMNTPSGGAHVYVRAPDYEVRGAARVRPEEFPGMDLRADGQLAIFYGTNPANGGSYETVRGGNVLALEDLPMELQRLLVERRRAAQSQPVDLPVGYGDFAESDELLKEALELVRSGSSRNSAGFHLACQLRDERKSFEEAEPVMYQFADAVAEGGHPYTRQEAYNSLVSAYSSPPREPRGLAGSKIGDGFAHTDLGNAERLVHLYGDDLRYATASRKWFIWDGQRWAQDLTEEIERRAKKTVREILRRAADVENDEQRTKLIGFARRSEASGRLRAMIDLAESEPSIPVLPDELDQDPWQFNAANGTVDLRTGKLHDHRRSDMLTKLAPTKYDPKASARQWRRFLSQILPDTDLRQFVQRAIGYSITGDTSEHVAFLLYGSGRMASPRSWKCSGQSSVTTPSKHQATSF